MATNIVVGNITFPFASDLTNGTYLDGVPWVLVPSGSTTLNEPTPVKTSQTTLGFSASTGTIGVGNTVQGGNSGATATVVHWSGAWDAGTKGNTNFFGIVVEDITNGPFTNGEVVTDTTTLGTVTLWTTQNPQYTRVMNGSGLNPDMQRVTAPAAGAGRTNTFDEAINYFTSNTGSDKLEPTFPLSVTAKDCIVKCISKADIAGGINGPRKGVIQEWACVHIVSTIPAADEISPPPFYHTPASRPTLTINVDRILERCNNWSATPLSGLIPTAAQYLTDFKGWGWLGTHQTFGNSAQRSGLDGVVGSAGATAGGYECALAYNSRGTYGEYTGAMVSLVPCYLHTDAATEAQKRDIIAQVAAVGLHTWYSFKDSTPANDYFTFPDGGHDQWHDMLMALAFGWTEMRTELEGYAGTYQGADGYAGHMIYQFGRVGDQRAKTDFTTAHSDATKPVFTKSRTISNVTGTGPYTITVNVSEFDWVNIALGKVLWDTAETKSATITSMANVDNPATIANIVIATQPGTPFAVSDTVFMKPAADFPLDGHVYWSIREWDDQASTQPTVGLASDLNYQKQNNFTGQIFAIKSFGFCTEDLQRCLEYTEMCHTANSPTSTVDYEYSQTALYRSGDTNNYGYPATDALWSNYYSNIRTEPYRPIWLKKYGVSF